MMYVQKYEKEYDTYENWNRRYQFKRSKSANFVTIMFIQSCLEWITQIHLSKNHENAEYFDWDNEDLSVFLLFDEAAC